MAVLNIQADSTFARLLRSPWAARLFKCAAALLVLNEIRGAVLAAPVLYALWQSGGTFMAWWLAFCSLAGIALSVVVPVFIVRKLRRLA